MLPKQQRRKRAFQLASLDRHNKQRVVQRRAGASRAKPVTGIPDPARHIPKSLVNPTHVLVEGGSTLLPASTPRTELEAGRRQYRIHALQREKETPECLLCGNTGLPCPPKCDDMRRLLEALYAARPSHFILTSGSNGALLVLGHLREKMIVYNKAQSAFESVLLPPDEGVFHL